MLFENVIVPVNTPTGSPTTTVDVEALTKRTPTMRPLIIAMFIIYVVTMYLYQPARDATVMQGKAFFAGEYWRLLSYNFLHGSILHICLNMAALAIFGRQVYTHFGIKAFYAIFLLGGVGGGLLQGVLAPEIPMVGASAGIMGMWGAMVAAAARLKETPRGHRKLSEILNLGSMVTYVIVQAVLDHVIPGIAWAAHVGGFIVGLGLGMVLVLDGGEVLFASRPGLVRIVRVVQVFSKTKAWRSHFSHVVFELTEAFDAKRDFVVLQRQKLGINDTQLYTNNVVAGVKPASDNTDQWTFVADATEVAGFAKASDLKLIEQKVGEAKS